MVVHSVSDLLLDVLISSSLTALFPPESYLRCSSSCCWTWLAATVIACCDSCCCYRFLLLDLACCRFDSLLLLLLDLASCCSDSLLLPSVNLASCCRRHLLLLVSDGTTMALVCHRLHLDSSRSIIRRLFYSLEKEQQV